MFTFFTYFFYLLHFLWGIVIILGTTLAFFGRLHRMIKLQYAYLFCVGSIIGSYLLFNECLLTSFENYFRKLNGETVFKSFFERTFDYLGLSIDLDRFSLIFTYFLILGLFSIVVWNIKYLYDNRQMSKPSELAKL